jgi:hypothetical protein
MCFFLILLGIWTYTQPSIILGNYHD